MTNDLFAYARRSDPGTSHAAARSLNGQTLTRLEMVVLEAIRKCRDGATIDELVDLTGLEKVTVSPRLAPLFRKGKLTPRCSPSGSHPISRAGKSGRKQIVWFLCQQ